MKFKLHNHKELNLPKKLAFDKRVDLIVNEILENPEHEFYYNKNSLRLRDGQIQNIVDRWLGVKRVNMPHKDETLKISFDILSTYLIYSNDYSAKDDIHIFVTLMNRSKSKRQKDLLTNDEESNLFNLKSDVIFYRIHPKSSNKESVVFFENKKYERFLNKRIKFLKEMLEIEYDKDTETTLHRLISNRKSIGELKNKAKHLFNKINNYKEDVNESKLVVKELYSKLRDNKDDLKTIDLIKVNLTNIKHYQSQINILEEEIKSLSDDYMQLTELFIQQA